VTEPVIKVINITLVGLVTLFQAEPKNSILFDVVTAAIIRNIKYFKDFGLVCYEFVEVSENYVFIFIFEE
jgi:hypothetical protein